MSSGIPDTTGLAIFGLLKYCAGVQTYVTGKFAVMIGVRLICPPSMIPLSGPASTIGNGYTGTIACLVFTHPFAAVYVYVITLSPAPAAEGVNNPVAFTPGPENVPDAGVAVNW